MGTSKGRLCLLHQLGAPQSPATDPLPGTELGPGPASAHKLSTLCPCQKHAGFSCSSFVPDDPPERAPSLPPHSPSIASPGPEQVHCPAGPGPGPFQLSPLDKYPGFGFKEGPANSPGRFLKGSHVPFHPYKRHFQEDVFPEAQTALALDGHTFKTPGALETFEEIPADVGEAEAFLPSFPAEAWCNGLPYPSQEHSPQILVSTRGQWASDPPPSQFPAARNEASGLKPPAIPFWTFPLRVSVHQGNSKLRESGSLSFMLGLQVSWARGCQPVQHGRGKVGKAAQTKEAGIFPEAPESGSQCATSV